MGIPVNRSVSIHLIMPDMCAVARHFKATLIRVSVTSFLDRFSEIYVCTYIDNRKTTTFLIIRFVLNIFVFSINMSVKRLGGAYGGKIDLPNAVASAATVAANKLRRVLSSLQSHF